MKRQVVSILALSAVISSANALDNLSQIKIGENYFISASALNVRSSESLDSSANILGKIYQNHEVKTVSLGENESDQMVEIDVNSSSLTDSEKYYVSYKFLNSSKSEAKSVKIYAIQNIATERIRVYKRICIDGSCPNKMIAEFPMVAGEDKDGRRTYLGSYKITSWRKFYEDGSQTYPSWYKSSYPMPPGPTAGFGKWRKKKFLPSGEGSLRGAFGWYTAHIGPNADGQWTHGTIGWGESSKKFIKMTRGFWANLFANPRSHGCSRVNNQAIAYLRHLLPTGTPIIKIYAKEDIQDKTLSNYSVLSKQWDYALTTHRSLTADAETINLNGTKGSEILERGTYTVDMKPDVVMFEKSISKAKAKKGKGGNVYVIEDNQFQGVFHIDTGVVSNYSHPKNKKLEVWGYKDTLIPSFMKTKK